MKRLEEDVGWRELNMDLKNEVEMVWSCTVKRSNDNSILRRVIELEVEGRRPVGRPKKTWTKVVKEDIRKLNIMEDNYGRG